MSAGALGRRAEGAGVNPIGSPACGSGLVFVLLSSHEKLFRTL